MLEEMMNPNRLPCLCTVFQKNVWQELRGVTSAVRNLQSEQTEQRSQQRTIKKRSLAKGLPVRFQVPILFFHFFLVLLICTFFIQGNYHKV